VVGLCQADIPGIAQFVNSAQRRLLMCKEAGDEGWYSTFAEIAFLANRHHPYITLPREVARIEAMSVCDRPVPVNNQFFEYLEFGNGRLPKTRRQCQWPLTAAYTRNNAVTFVDLSNPPQNLQVVVSDPLDADGTHRVLIQGTDNNNNVFYSQDGKVRVTGEFLTLDAPFAAFPLPLNSLTGIQKDITNGPVQFYQVDPVTGVSELLLTMEPGETTASYRRYYLDSLPNNCCHTHPSHHNHVVVTAIAKLDLVPVVVDTDYLLIQNLEAIIEECASVRYSEVDNPTAKQMAAERHSQAVRMLIGELTHYIGKDNPAVSFKPFGSADLRRQRIGQLM